MIWVIDVAPSRERWWRGDGGWNGVDSVFVFRSFVFGSIAIAVQRIDESLATTFSHVQWKDLAKANAISRPTKRSSSERTDVSASSSLCLPDLLLLTKEAE